jgi:hypothetical protein
MHSTIVRATSIGQVLLLGQEQLLVLQEAIGLISMSQR